MYGILSEQPPCITELSFKRFVDLDFPNRITKDDKCWSSGCDSWALILGEAHRSRVCADVFVPNRGAEKNTYRRAL
jgi:hypothetical protein